MSEAELADRVGDLGGHSIEGGWPGVSSADAVLTGRERREQAGHQRCCIGTSQSLS